MPVNPALKSGEEAAKHPPLLISAIPLAWLGPYCAYSADPPGFTGGELLGPPGFTGAG